MAKKNEEIDIDEEIKRISRKTNVDLLKSERTFDNRIKNLEKEIEELEKCGCFYYGENVNLILLNSPPEAVRANFSLIKVKS